MKELTFTATALGVLFALSLISSAQMAPDDASTPAPNAWMLTPTPYLEWNKDVSPSVRKERDRYLDQGAVGQRYPLTSPHADPLGPGIGCGMSKTEIPPAINRVILTGTFTKHRSVLSASEFSLYSEITVHVDEVFEDQSGSGAAPGEDLTILVSGGTVTLASGRVLTYGTQPIRFSLQPDHRYLLTLSHYGAGSFYLVEDDWDTSDGFLRFNTRPDEYRAQHGLSSLSGLKIEELGPALATLLKEQK
jgi:hypothetical protein